ncbi:AsmA-like C-terminal region-containing protein [Nitratireductor sp. ZSWI3]|uniref:AsmA family protein n=1 Tax=Nitratireductor sp. ZSWI3 TaxID=2966359 RepID=UPI0021502D79|nr:AsmA-like C-terminal region-containing protein [Nitratireductor sp. ZSWI3]MCR4269003.1 AsmA family protein [Nitratireductor sp. ZSWI3]
MTKSIWALGIAAVIAVVAILCLPIIASTQIVRDSVAQQVSAWSGYRVRLDDAPQIRVWPSFKAILNDVVLTDWRDNQGPPVMEAERVEIDLSALAALRGEVVFTKIRLVRPVLRVNGANDAPRFQAIPKWGRLAQSIEFTRELLKANPNTPDLSALPSDAFATIEIEDGRVISASDRTQPPLASGLAGTLSWPALNRSAALTARGIWHGESIVVEASSEQPLVLLAGGKAPLSVTLKTAPVSLSFAGSADFDGNAFIDGRIETSAPSLQRVLEWTSREDWPGSTIKAASLKSNVIGDLTRIKFENAEIGLGENSATGVFDIGFTAPYPTVTGTLAFKSLDLRSLMLALAPDSDDPAASPVAHRLNLDLRLSAATATAGSVSMTGVAATAQVRDGLMSLDISDATAFGGMVQIGVRLDSIEDNNHAELRVNAENVNGKAVASTLNLTNLIPNAPGSFSVFIKGRGSDLQSVLETADGSISATIGKGTIPGLNLQSFREHNDQGTFFPLADIANGELPIDGIDFKATLAGGIAWIDKADIRLTSQEKITLGGLVPFAGRGIALSGNIVPAAPAEEGVEPPKETFFIGGSWSAPFIAPFLVE